MHTIDPRIIEAFNKTHDFKLEDHIVMMCVVGSQSHGTYVPVDDPDHVDDLDYMIVILPPPTYTLGVKHFEGWNFQFEELDVVAYSFQKMVNLLTNSNPNVLGTLWLREEDYLIRTEMWDTLIENRDLFSSKEAFKSFVGYANGQLKRMTVLTPQHIEEYEKAEAVIEAAGWKTEDVINGKPLGMPKDAAITPELHGPAREYIIWFHGKFHQKYMGIKRKNLVKKFKFDTKQGAHCIRLLEMGVEFLATGKMNVFRTGASVERIKAIKSGKWSLEDVHAYAEKLFAEAHLVHAQSALPEFMNRDEISEIVSGLILEEYEVTGELDAWRNKYGYWL